MKQAAMLTKTPPTFLCWLASFPRSGNTWVRNIFYEVFGLKSGTWDVNDKGRVLQPECFSKPIVKTHMLPSQLMHDGDDKKVIYLVRDGRDAMVSISHHRSDFVVPGSDFLDNMQEAILAQKGSYFGGWSENVERWMERADLVIRYEDLLMDEEGALEKIRCLLELPEADYSKVPRFDKMKHGLPRYGSGNVEFAEEERKRYSGRFFRRGKSGAWRDEMPPDLHDLFWSIHGDTMLKMGYRYDGEVESTPDPDLDWKVAQLMRKPVAAPAEKIVVTLEANNLLSPVNHGGKRHLALLLKELMHVQRNPQSGWDFRLFAGGNVMPLTEAQELLENSLKDTRCCAEQLAQESDPCLSSKELTPQSPGTVAETEGRNPVTRIIKFLEKGKQRMKAIFLQKSTCPKHGGDMGSTAFIEGAGDIHVIHLLSSLHNGLLSKERPPMVASSRYFPCQLQPEFHSPAEVKGTQRAWNFALEKNASLITTPKAAGREAGRLAGDRVPSVFVIHDATERARFHRKINGHDRRAVRAKYGIPVNTPFFFAESFMAGGDALQNVLRAFLELVQKKPRLDVMLVLGGTRSREELDLQNLPGFDSDKVHFTGFIKDEDLPFLFSDALAFCHVSAVEGLTPNLQTALNCGTPVICGNHPSLLEIVGDAGLPVPPSDPHELSLQMLKVKTDKKLRAKLLQAALRQAARFSSRKMARETLDCYLEALKQKQKH